MKYRIKEYVGHYKLEHYVPQYKPSFWPFWIDWCAPFSSLGKAKEEAKRMKRYFETKSRYHYDI